MISPRAAGVCGVAFVVGLFIAGAMVSLPTAAESGDHIRSFYAAHAQVVIVQQALSVLLLPLFVVFGLGLGAQLGDRRGVILGTALVVLAELCTNLPPLILVATSPSSGTAHTLTVIEDLADAALFAAIGIFSAAVAIASRSWPRIIAAAVAVVTLARAVTTPVHWQVLEIVAPLAFLALVLAVSVWMIVVKRRLQPDGRHAQGPAAMPPP
jgi:hypothetical protein